MSENTDLCSVTYVEIFCLPLFLRKNSINQNWTKPRTILMTIPKLLFLNLRWIKYDHKRFRFDRYAAKRTEDSDLYVHGTAWLTSCQFHFKTGKAANAFAICEYLLLDLNIITSSAFLRRALILIALGAVMSINYVEF